MQKIVREKVQFLALTSISNCAYPKNWGYKISTTLHGVFNAVSGNMFFVIPIFNIHGGKVQFFASSQFSMFFGSVQR